MNNSAFRSDLNYFSCTMMIGNFLTRDMYSDGHQAHLHFVNSQLLVVVMSCNP